MTLTLEGTTSGNVIDDSLENNVQYANLQSDNLSHMGGHVLAKLDPLTLNTITGQSVSMQMLEEAGFQQGTESFAAQPDGVELHDHTISYTYDTLNRLTGADYHDGTYFNYTYDAVGNRLSEASAGGTTTLTYDAADRIHTMTDSLGSVTYTWDGNGNLLSDGTATYSYNTANRLTGLTKGTDVYSYAYNGLGDRYAQTANNVTTTYQLDLAANLVQVLSDGDITYLYGLNRIAQTSTTQTDYFLPDALGSMRQMIDPSGAIQLARSYTPFGEKLSTGTARMTRRIRYFPPAFS